MKTMITVIGRGHSGTRAISHTLAESGVDMGAEVNDSGDLIPADQLYEACRIMGDHVKHLGGTAWDFSALHAMPIPDAFIQLVEEYLSSVLDSEAEWRGWKLPETTLIYPWIVRLFPEVRYIYWVRDPRDCILQHHLTDDLSRFNVRYEPTEDIRERRAISWKYQSAIYHATPRPKHLIEVKFEDFVLDQENTLARLEEYLGFPLARIPVRAESVGRWRNDPEQSSYECFAEDARLLGYT